jgi:hypothetical protein
VVSSDRETSALPAPPLDRGQSKELEPSTQAPVAGGADPRTTDTSRPQTRNELDGFAPGKYRAKPSRRSSGQNPGNSKEVSPDRVMSGLAAVQAARRTSA